jgi:hypothetical protein
VSNFPEVLLKTGEMMGRPRKKTGQMLAKNGEDDCAAVLRVSPGGDDSLRARVFLARLYRLTAKGAVLPGLRGKARKLSDAILAEEPGATSVMVAAMDGGAHYLRARLEWRARRAEQAFASFVLARVDHFPMAGCVDLTCCLAAEAAGRLRPAVGAADPLEAPLPAGGKELMTRAQLLTEARALAAEGADLSALYPGDHLHFGLLLGSSVAEKPSAPPVPEPEPDPDPEADPEAEPPTPEEEVAAAEAAAAKAAAEEEAAEARAQAAEEAAAEAAALVVSDAAAEAWHLQRAGTTVETAQVPRALSGPTLLRRALAKAAPEGGAFALEYGLGDKKTPPEVPSLAFLAFSAFHKDAEVAVASAAAAEAEGEEAPAAGETGVPAAAFAAQWASIPFVEKQLAALEAEKARLAAERAKADAAAAKNAAAANKKKKKK